VDPVTPTRRIVEALIALMVFANLVLLGRHALGLADHPQPAPGTGTPDASPASQPVPTDTMTVPAASTTPPADPVSRPPGSTRDPAIAPGPAPRTGPAAAPAPPSIDFSRPIAIAGFRLGMVPGSEEWRSDGGVGTGGWGTENAGGGDEAVIVNVAGTVLLQDRRIILRKGDPLDRVRTLFGKPLIERPGTLLYELALPTPVRTEKASYTRALFIVCERDGILEEMAMGALSYERTPSFYVDGFVRTPAAGFQPMPQLLFWNGQPLYPWPTFLNRSTEHMRDHEPHPRPPPVRPDTHPVVNARDGTVLLRIESGAFTMGASDKPRPGYDDRDNSPSRPRCRQSSGTSSGWPRGTAIRTSGTACWWEAPRTHAAVCASWTARPSPTPSIARSPRRTRSSLCSRQWSTPDTWHPPDERSRCSSRAPTSSTTG